MPASAPPAASPYHLAFRLAGIPALAVAGVLIYRGLYDRFVLPECDSQRARTTLAQVFKELNFAPLRYEPMRTVSSGRDAVVCNAVLPLPDGADLAVDYSFFWQGGKAAMKYSVARQAPGESAPAPAAR